MAKEPYGNINLDLIREMSEAHGISGCEKEVSRVMKLMRMDLYICCQLEAGGVMFCLLKPFM